MQQPLRPVLKPSRVVKEEASPPWLKVLPAQDTPPEEQEPNQPPKGIDDLHDLTTKLIAAYGQPTKGKNEGVNEDGCVDGYI